MGKKVNSENNKSYFKNAFDSVNHVLSSANTSYGYNVAGNQNLGSFKLSTNGFQGNQYVKMQKFYPGKIPRHIRTNLGKIAKVNNNISLLISGESVYNNIKDGNYKKASGEVGSLAYGLIYGKAGADIGASIGLIGGPAGSAAGYIIGGLAGGLMGSLIGEKVGNICYDTFTHYFGNKSTTSSGLTGHGDTGGVEFVILRIIPEFKNNFCFYNKLYISFKKYSTETEQEILNLLNHKLLINGQKINNMEQVFSTILYELSVGYLVDKKLPFISLNFNKEGLLYPIMDEYYKHTLVGCILTMLDYYLKCYVNGGFFKEEFVYEWQKTKNTDKLYLDENFYNMKMYLVSVHGDKNKIHYKSLNDMKSTEFTKKRIFSSAFRIIEYDIDISPDFKASATYDMNKQKIIEDNEKVHKLMTLWIKKYMNSVPSLKPYFELLNIITFCIHYLPNIQACGLFPDLSDTLIKNKNKYIANIPHIFPPLPVKKTIKVEVSFTMKELMNMLSESQKKILNTLISIQFLELECNLELMEKNNRLIEKEITIYMNKKIKKLLGENAYLVDITSDDDLNIYYVIKTFTTTAYTLVGHKLQNSCKDLSNAINATIEQ
ncbi:hypothetical protein BCR32DRAFT_244755 [Anaeromyces robustus]|uniref:Glycine zipper domain-containing protein n=1 Tax=Anaeromyces robustus TaxID=1754192 RepID=A0A1Y1X795_9FUNG|nr:hypothetical protein BCR32DRAFT_244755 [Anaeromyces robustus]|eukprot:ORX81639.1 hypothetical protein BCR32DRAFT_244755 [Anaeromyces robustus]